MEQAVEKFINWLEQEEDNIYQNTKQEAKKQYKHYLLHGENILGETSENIANSLYENIHKDLIGEYKKNGLMSKISKIDYLLDILTDKKHEIISERVLFTDFTMLCELLLESNLNTKEKVNIVLFFLEKDMRSFDEDAYIIAYEDIKDLKMPSMSEKEFKKFVQGESFVTFFEKNFDELTEEEKIFDLQLRIRIDEKKLSNSIISALKSIQRHYFNKKIDLNETDIRITAKSMEVLGVTPGICFAFQSMLENKIIKERKESQPSSKKAIVEKTEYDYKSLEKEVSEVIDLKDMKPKRYLSLEEKVYYLSILTKMNVLKEERSLFLRNCEMGLEEASPLREYVENYNRLKYYEESVGLQKEIAFMEECFKEMLLCNHDDYYFWKQSLEETLKQVEHWIPKNYEYEEAEASRLLKK